MQKNKKKHNGIQQYDSLESSSNYCWNKWFHKMMRKRIDANLSWRNTWK